MTIEEFERHYAEESGVTVEWLHEHGMRAEVCDCGYNICSGFAMTALPGKIVDLVLDAISGEGS